MIPQLGGPPEESRRPAGARARVTSHGPSGIPTPRINQLVLGYLLDISGIGQGHGQLLDIPGVSFEVFGVGSGEGGGGRGKVRVCKSPSQP
jgi:hypothetical protein